jgi:hypothetical protein
MAFELTPRTAEILERLNAFMVTHIYPNEPRHAEEAEKLGP